MLLNTYKCVSKETRAKMSEAKRGKPSNRLGSHLTIETRKKISDALKGRPLSEERRKKLCDRCGEKNSFWGKHHSEETKKKIREIHKGRKYSKETLKNMSNGQLGRHHPEEVRKKISEAHKIRFLSQELREACKGEKNPNWKGGITSENAKIRSSIELRLWREAVFARDNWTCQKCGQKSGELNAHHIKPFAKYPELRFAVNNGLTFCKQCHKKKGLHKWRIDIE